MIKLVFISIIAIAVFSVPFALTYGQNTYEIPSWVKDLAGFWADGKISNYEFSEALRFLIDSGIISVLTVHESQETINHPESKDGLPYKVNTVSYSIGTIPPYADELIVEEAINKAFYTWERINPGLDFIKVHRYGEITFEFEKGIIGEDTLGYTELACIYDCVIVMALGDQDCKGKWSQFTMDSLSSIAMHEIGHTIGIVHTLDEASLMYSPTPEIYYIYDELGYTIPKQQTLA